MSAVTGDQTHTNEVLEKVEYGQLWSDGTFDPIHWSDKSMAHRKFTEGAYRLNEVPQSLRPVFASRRVITTIETYTPEAVEEKS